MSVSVVMTSFNRPVPLHHTLGSIARQRFPNLEVIVVDDGTDKDTEKVCHSFGATHIKVSRPHSEVCSTPAWPNNVGIRHAKGDIIVLQNAECLHVDPKTIEKLTSGVSDRNVSFAHVTALHADGSFYMVYCGKENPRPLFFCGAIQKRWFEKLRGFDEEFYHSGYDDNDFGDRLRHEGMTFEFSDVEVHHQWHPSSGRIDIEPMRILYEKKLAAMNSGEITAIRNFESWGEICKGTL